MASPAPLILGAAALLALLASASAGGTKPDRPRRNPITDPVPVPESDDDLLLVDKTLCECWESLGRPEDVAQLRLCAAEALHPDIGWPPIPQDHATVHALWELFGERAKTLIAMGDPEAFCEGLFGPDPNELIQEWFEEEPTAGKFYKIGGDPELSGNDSLSKLVRRTLNRSLAGAGNNSGRRLEYMRCITSGPRWNWPLYASTSFSENFPKLYFVNGRGLRRAFYPWHVRAEKAFFDRRYPKRAITTAGAKIKGVGAAWATLWLPPLDPDALAEGVVTCGFQDWTDGSSSIDPPPEVFDILQGSENVGG